MIKHKNNETWDQGIETKDLELGKSNGGIGGLKPYNKNKNWNRLILSLIHI